jgi:alpha-D-xyloside xylohydrolase
MKQEFIFSEGEAIYGLGQHEDGILNYRGHSQTLYQHNRKLPMPIIISSRGYACFFNTYSFSAFHDDEHGSYFWSEYVNELDYFFIFGPEFDQLISEIRNLTGKSAMLPIWAYGYWQSKEHYKTQKEILDIAREYRERGIPIDVIVQDWKYWPGEQWGEKRFDPERYPEPEGLLKKLHDMHIRMIISIWTQFNNYGPNHKEMSDKGLLLKNNSNINLFEEDARKLHWKQIKEGLYKYEIDGWWCDGTEPFDGMRPTQFREEYFKRVQLDIEEYKRYIDPQYINAYPLLNAMAIYEGMRSANEGKRVLNLTRACYPGQQRYGTIVWSGDIVANWEVLKRHIADGLNFCMTGHSNWTLDIGGFFVKDRRDECWWHAGDYTSGVEDAGYRELYVRWFQFGTFLPVFRSHGTDISPKIQTFGFLEKSKLK